MTRPFLKGDVLIVKPKDMDDPEATACTGETCRFVRYGQFTDFAVVQFDEDSRFFYFRPEDLEKVEEAS